jgi:hypothetical protein
MALDRHQWHVQLVQEGSWVEKRAARHDGHLAGLWHRGQVGGGFLRRRPTRSREAKLTDITSFMVKKKRFVFFDLRVALVGNFMFI